jgi:Xaa-Pro aminopeptidase
MGVCMGEYDTKYNKIKDLIHEKNLDGILITQQPNFFWLIGGKNYVNIQTRSCICKLLVTISGLYLIGNNVDIPLIFEEEIRDPNIKKLTKTKIYNWQEEDKENEYINDFLINGRYGSDKKMENAEYVGDALYDFRTILSNEEIKRYRILGQQVAIDLEEIVRNIKKGDSELEIAGKIMSRLYQKEILPVVLLVAVDERTYKYRHPLPTSKKLEKIALISVCGKKGGLIASATRAIHFGKPPKELIQRHKAVAKIEAQLINYTRPGEKIANILQRGIKTYGKEGYKDEWKLHFQGGTTGYNTREHKATLKSTEIVRKHQAFAWNPSISGTKSEDTFLVLPDRNEIITETGRFPYIEEFFNGISIKRPDILIKTFNRLYLF